MSARARAARPIRAQQATMAGMLQTATALPALFLPATRGRSRRPRGAGVRDPSPKMKMRLR